MVVNPNVQVGNNCSIYMGVNIGANKNKFDTPEIGDNIYIRPRTKKFARIL